MTDELFLPGCPESNSKWKHPKPNSLSFHSSYLPVWFWHLYPSLPSGHPAPPRITLSWDSESCLHDLPASTVFPIHLSHGDWRETSKTTARISCLFLLPPENQGNMFSRMASFMDLLIAHSLLLGPQLEVTGLLTWTFPTFFPSLP